MSEPERYPSATIKAMGLELSRLAERIDHLQTVNHALLAYLHSPTPGLLAEVTRLALR